jgi:hypothetical protein
MKTPIILSILVMALFSCGEDRIPADKENFHLYLLMGQSNMAGRGKVEATDTLTHPRVYMLNREMNWVLARDPIHFDKPIAGAGLGLTFGKEMADRNSNVRIGLIPCAKGGSSINQWFKDSLHLETNTYPYNEMIVKAKKAMSDGVLKGILWHQGESDTQTKSSVDSYPVKFKAMLDSLKADLNLSSVPVVIGEMGYFYYIREPLAEALNTVLNQIALTNNCIDIVRAEGLDHKGDTIHFNSESLREMGRRYAAKMTGLQAACPAVFER